MKQNRSLLFASFRLDLHNEQLWREDILVPLPPKTFAVLRYLVEHRNRVVPKEELLKEVWSGTRVSAGIVKGYIRDLREALGDDAQAPRFIETVSRRGHRFIAALNPTSPVASSSSSSAQPSALNTQHSVVVGREVELSQLHDFFAKALRGERQLIFVTGETGIGKTTLVETFLKQVQTLDDIRIGRGQCVEHYGAGEAYLPILQALGQLGRGPNGKTLIENLKHYAPTWLMQLPALLEDAELEALQRKIQGATQERMLRELAEALEVVTSETPLLLCLEDLHWSDHTTIDFLSLLARRREPARLLVIGTYRPAEVVVNNHPLKMTKQELQIHGQCAELPLNFLNEVAIAAYLANRYPGHQFPPELARMIQRSTDGNPLFLVNIVDFLEMRGAIREERGSWRLRTSVEEAGYGIPESLRQLIEKHAERLPSEDQRLLEIASVVGQEFSAALITAILDIPIEQIEARCDILGRQGQFLRAKESRILPDGVITAQYGFLHGLYQSVLYDRIPVTRRMRLHRRIGESVELLYGQHSQEMASELAVHFDRGQEPRQAIKYLHLATDTMLRRHAPQEAVISLKRALELLQSFPDSHERASQELTLQLLLGVASMSIKGLAATEVESAYTQARELCRRIGDTTQIFPALVGLHAFHTVRGELKTGLEINEQLLRVAQEHQDRGFLLEAHLCKGNDCYFLGDCAGARQNFEEVLALYNIGQHGPHAFIYGHDPGVLAHSALSWTLWHLGYPDQALQHSQNALTVAANLAHAPSSAFALWYTTVLHGYRREWSQVQGVASDLHTLSSAQGLPLWLSLGTYGQGWGSEGGQLDEVGLAQMQQGITAYRGIGAALGVSGIQAWLAEKYYQVGRIEEGLRLISDAFSLMQITHEGAWSAELWRLKGELLLQTSIPRLEVRKSGRSKVSNFQSLTPSPHVESEECFLKALEIARQQQAKSLELRAVMSLARLWRVQGKTTAAHELLASVYTWFTEGFDTADLKDAKILLNELSDYSASALHKEPMSSRSTVKRRRASKKL